MSDAIEVEVPDLGDFADVPIIEVHVSEGDEISAEDSLVTLESEKASMDVPAPQGGTVKELRVSVGDKVSAGDVLLTLESSDGTGEGEQPADRPAEAESADEHSAGSGSPVPAGDRDSADRFDAQVLVLGAGPGGYTAAFRAADLGLKTVLVERYPTLGGVCLNVGCIPSKALLHAARVVTEAEEFAEHGISFGKPRVDLDALREWKNGVVGKLTGGLTSLAKRRKVEVVQGEGRFAGANELKISGPDGDRTISFEHCVIAAGSRVATLPDLPDDERIIDSTGALELREVPRRLLVIGGGIIGLEMATVFDALGSSVTVVELLDTLIPGCDPDLVKPLRKRIDARYDGIHLGTKVTGVKALKKGLRVAFEGKDAPESGEFDAVLVAVGRRPNGDRLDAEAAGVEVDERGFIRVDRQMRTNVDHIHAIGDVVGQPMLAHKASHEAKVAAEVITGKDVEFDPRAIPAVAYTDPEVAWMGLTETQAKEDGVKFEKAVFPWAASGRALSLGRSEGLTKLLVEPESKRVLGAGIVGVNAGELIAEAVHAIEMGAVAEDVGLTIHPHPTLTETLGFSAEVAEKTITDL